MELESEVTELQRQLAKVDLLTSTARRRKSIESDPIDSLIRFSNLKNELVHHILFEDRDQARTEIFD